MREIKFRAWNKLDKIMIQNVGFVPDFAEDTYVDRRNGLFAIKPGLKYELLQYTGLKDKNGVEIYEGDILILPGSFGDNKDPYLVRVEWASSDSIHGWYVNYIGDGEYGGLYDSLVERGEVIGNIYSNPELLERTDEKLRT